MTARDEKYRRVLGENEMCVSETVEGDRRFFEYLSLLVGVVARRSSEGLSELSQLAPVSETW